MAPEAYDPLPDIAVTLAGVFSTPAYTLPPSTFGAFGRLMDKLGIRPGQDYPPPAAAIESKLRGALGGRAGDG